MPPIHALTTLLCFSALGLFACQTPSIDRVAADPAKDPGAAAGNTDSDGEPRGAVGNHIVCDFYYRKTNEVREDTEPADLTFQELQLRVEPNGDKSGELGQLRLHVDYADEPEEGVAIHISVETDQGSLFRTLYQLPSGELPRNQFVGDHGFTGLMYLTHPDEGGDYQLICKTGGAL